MSKYASLDQMIIASIANKPGIEFTELCGRQAVKIRADAIADEENKLPRKGFHYVEGWRVVDRRLQALRKAGKIIYGRGKNAGWRLAEGGAA